MTVAIQDPINAFVITATTQTEGPWTWQLNAEEDLTVFKTIEATGVVVKLVLNTDYTVDEDMLGNKEGGNITFLEAQLDPVVGDIWTLQRDTALIRSESFVTGGDFRAVAVNPQFDDPILMLQDTQRNALAPLRKNPTVGSVLNPLIPQPINRRTLIFESDGEDPAGYDIVMSRHDPDTESENAATSAEEAADSAAAALVSENASAASSVNSSGFADDSAASAVVSSGFANASSNSADESAVSAAAAATSALEATGVTEYLSKVIPLGPPPSDSTNTLDLSGQFTTPEHLTFNPDGSKVFVSGDSEISEYALATDWDISSGTFTSSFSTTGAGTPPEATPQGIEFNDDGTQLILAGSAGNKLYEITLGTAYTLSTASFTANELAIGSQTGNAQGIKYSPDGKQLFLSSREEKIFMYELSTAYDFTTMSYSNDSFDTSAEENDQRGLDITPDGRKLVTVDGNPDTVREWHMSIPFDITTMFYSELSLNITATDIISNGFRYGDSGNKFYFIGANNNKIFEFDLSSTYSITQQAITVQAHNDGNLFSCDTASADVDITLVDSTTLSKDFRIAVVRKSGSNVINVDRSGSDLINGSASDFVIAASDKIVAFVLNKDAGEYTAAPKLADFRGAFVDKSSNQSISSSTTTAISFDQEIYDTDDIHDNSTNNTRLTVPTGITRVRLTGNASYGASASNTGRTQVSVLKNSTFFAGAGSISLANTSSTFLFGRTINVTTPVVIVSAGDFFELAVFQDSGGSFNVFPTEETWFAMELIE